MEPGAILLAALGYAAAAVGREVADPELQKLYDDLREAVRDRYGSEAEAGASARASDRVSTLARGIVGVSGGLRRAIRHQKVVTGARLLWAARHPQATPDAKALLQALGLSVQVVASNEAAKEQLGEVEYDVVVSDLDLGDADDPAADLLSYLVSSGYAGRVVHYVDRLGETRWLPAGVRGITDHPDELLHLILDVLERRRL